MRTLCYTHINPFISRFKITSIIYYCITFTFLYCCYYFNNSILGLLPAYALDEDYGSVTDTLWIIKLSSPSNFESWLTESIYTLPENKKRISQNTKLINLSITNSKYEFSDTVKEFEFRCREKQFL